MKEYGIPHHVVNSITGKELNQQFMQCDYKNIEIDEIENLSWFTNIFNNKKAFLILAYFHSTVENFLL